MKLEQNNNRGILYRVAVSNLKGKKLYSFFSLLTIFAAITFVSTLVIFLIGTQTAKIRTIDHMQQVMFMNVSEEQMKNIGADKNTLLMLPYKYNDMEFQANQTKYKFYYFEPSSETIKTYMPAQGRAPKSYEEIVVDKKFMEQMGIEAAIDTRIVLSLDGTCEEFTICGYTDYGYERSAYPVYVSKEFADSSQVMERQPYTALVSLKNAKEMTLTEFETHVYQMANDYGIGRMDVNINGKFEDFLRGGNAALYAILFVSLLIMAASGLVIYSIFYLSVTSRVKQFGQLLTIGMTQKQLKGMIRKEGFLLSGFAIPAGLLLSGAIAYFLEPEGWSFINFGIALLILGILGVLVVQFSIGRPAYIASMVSPIEAAKNSSPDETGRERDRKHKKLTPLSLARMEMNRNRKKWWLTTVSLAFGGIILMAAVSTIASWNEENYSRQGRFTNADFEVFYLYDAHTSPQPYGITDLQLTGHLDEALRKQLSQIPNVKNIEVLHSTFGNIKYQDASFSESFSFLTENSQEYYDAVTEGNATYDYLVEHDGILITNTAFIEELNGVKFIPGKKLSLSWFDGEEHTAVLEIAGIIPDIISQDIDSSFFIADKTMKKLWPDMNTASSFRISTKDYEKNGKQVEEDIKKVLNPYSDLVLSTFREQKMEDSASTQRLNIQIYGVCAFVILFSLFNLVNTIISSITTRKKELSMLESIGMEEKQIQKMLFWESFFIMLPNLFITLTIGSGAGFLAVSILDHIGNYMEYHFPFYSCILYMAAMILIPMGITLLCLRGQNKTSLVERIKTMDE